MLRSIYHYLLKGRPRRNVGPIPIASIDQKAVDCADANSEAFELFLKKISLARSAADATPQVDVDRDAAETCGRNTKEIGLYLPGRGFVKIRPKRGLANINNYQYNFEIDGITGGAKFVKVIE